MIQYIIIIISSFITFFIFYKISYRLNLLDIPSKRKKHDVPVPYTGGFSIGIVFLIIVFIIDFNTKTLNFLLTYSFLISICGLIDDKYNLSVGPKLCLELVPILILIFLTNLVLEDIGTYEILGQIKLGSFNLIFTVLCVLLLINSVNYVDGIDGSACMITVSSLFLLLLFINDFSSQASIFISYSIIPIMIFLIFNFSIFKIPKMFLGDSGSLLLGFYLSFLLIFVYKSQNVHPILIAWTINLYVYEFISTNILRLSLKKGLFIPGYDHIHFYLIKLTKSDATSSLILFIINFTMGLLGLITFKYFNSITSFFLYIVMFLIYLQIRIRISKVS